MYNRVGINLEAFGEKYPIGFMANVARNLAKIESGAIRVVLETTVDEEDGIVTLEGHQISRLKTVRDHCPGSYIIVAFENPKGYDEKTVGQYTQGGNAFGKYIAMTGIGGLVDAYEGVRASSSDEVYHGWFSAFRGALETHGEGGSKQYIPSSAKPLLDSSECFLVRSGDDLTEIDINKHITFFDLDTDDPIPVNALFKIVEASLVSPMISTVLVPHTSLKHLNKFMAAQRKVGEWAPPMPLGSDSGTTFQFGDETLALMDEVYMDGLLLKLGEGSKLTRAYLKDNVSADALKYVRAAIDAGRQDSVEMYRLLSAGVDWVVYQDTIDNWIKEGNPRHWIIVGLLLTEIKKDWEALQDG